MQIRDRNTKAGSGLSAIEDGRFPIVHQRTYRPAAFRWLDSEAAEENEQKNGGARARGGR